MAISDTQRNYIERLKQVRAANMERRAKGKELLYSEDQFIKLVAEKKKIPEQMQHCVIKVYGKVKGPEKERFLSAFNICAAVFENNDYQKQGLTLTDKGVRNSLRHRSEDEHSIKEDIYMGMQAMWDGAVNMYKDSLAPKPPPKGGKTKGNKKTNPTAKSRMKDEE